MTFLSTQACVRVLTAERDGDRRLAGLHAAGVKRCVIVFFAPGN